jgi:hypothetical protein
MKNTMTHRGINRALSEGCTIHAFLSGGGLRVVRIEKDGDLKGYGEHPNVETAMAHANKDFLAGGRPYHKVYGGEELHYLTGSPVEVSELDGWLLHGHTFDIRQEGAEVVAELRGLVSSRTPKKIENKLMDRAKRNLPAEAYWKNRGYTYYSEAGIDSGGEVRMITSIVSSHSGRSGSDPWMYYIVKTGRGADYAEALANAFLAPEVEDKK